MTWLQSLRSGGASFWRIQAADGTKRGPAVGEEKQVRKGTNQFPCVKFGIKGESRDHEPRMNRER